MTFHLRNYSTLSDSEVYQCCQEHIKIPQNRGGFITEDFQYLKHHVNQMTMVAKTLLSGTLEATRHQGNIDGINPKTNLKLNWLSGFWGWRDGTFKSDHMGQSHPSFSN